MKALLALIFVLSLLLVGCGRQGASRGLELQKEDYKTARKNFKTRLMRPGAAPQQYEDFRPPAGTQVISYSRTLPLKALIGPIPSDGKRYPAVLFLHGGFAMDDSDWESSQSFRDAGFVVMTPMLRGENGQPGAYTLFFDEVSDVLAASETLAAQPFVDKNRLYVAGHSVGGTLAILAALSSKQFRAAAAFSGSCDQVLWSEGQEELLPFDADNRDELRIRSPIAYATSFQCPTRIYYGSEEPGFAGMSRETARLAKTRALDVEAVEVPGDHITALEGEIEKSIAFFRAH